MADDLTHAPPAMVSRAWLRAALQVPPDDPDRLVDIVHARFVADPPATRDALGKTLGVSAATIGKRERAALAWLRATPLEQWVGPDALHEDDRLYLTLVAQAEADAETDEAAAEPAPPAAEAEAAPVTFEPAPELTAAVQAPAAGPATRKR